MLLFFFSYPLSSLFARIFPRTLNPLAHRVSMEQLFQEHPSDHLQVVAGDWVAGLVEICEKLGIGYKVQDENLEYEKIA